MIFSISVDSEPRVQISRAQGPRRGIHSRLLGALEALIRKETANDSVSALWPLALLMALLLPQPQGFRRCRSVWGKVAPRGSLPAFPQGTGTGTGPGLGFPGDAWRGPRAALAGPRVVTLPASPGPASWASRSPEQESNTPGASIAPLSPRPPLWQALWAYSLDPHNILGLSGASTEQWQRNQKGQLGN